MKSMLKNRPFTAVVIIFSVIFLVTSSCKKEDEPEAPVISSFELGYQNSHTAIPGGDLHLEAEIVAEGTIQWIGLIIHPEGEHEGDHPSAYSTEPWEVDTTYTGKYSGIKNTNFHEHIEIPATADTGSYHVHFTVTDQEGNQTALEEVLELMPVVR